MWTLQTFLRRLIWAGMAPLLALGLVALAFDLWSTKTQRDRDLAQAARLTRDFLDLKLQAEARALSLLAASLPQRADGPVTPGFYLQAQAFREHFGDHVVLAQQGQMPMNTRVAFGVALPAMPVVQGRSAASVALATGAPAVGDLFTGPISQSPLLALAVPAGPPQAPAPRVLVATMEATRFVKRLQQFPLPQGVRVGLFDSTGRSIASHPAQDHSGSPTELTPSFLSKRLELPLQAAPWRLVLEADGAVERTQLLRNLALWLAALLGASVMAYGAAAGAGRRLVAGFRALTPGAPELPANAVQIRELAQTRELLQQLDRDRDAQEAALRVREHQAWELLRVIPTPMLVTHEGVVEFANQSACALMGIDLKSLLGQQPANRIHPQDKAAADALRAALPQQSGAKVSTRLRIFRPDGAVRDVDSTLVRIDLGSESRLLSVARDVTLEKAALEELEQSRAELRWLLQQLIDAQELERKRIALDIHDDLQQALASIKLTAAALGHPDGELQQHQRRELTAALDQQVAQAVLSTRRIIDGLRPPALDDLGLAAALQALVARFGRETGLQCSFDADGLEDDERAVAPALAITLYRVAQEALNNVRKHAQARGLSVQLTQGADGQIELRVRDDGRGLPPTALASAGSGSASGLGMAGMRERMRAAGGSFELRPADGGGTEVVARAPNV